MRAAAASSHAMVVGDSGEDGHSHTDALHIVERFRRHDFGHMDLQLTTIAFDLLPDTELIESICENEKDAAYLVGK